jgi:hypothetical protein
VKIPLLACGFHWNRWCVQAWAVIICWWQFWIEYLVQCQLVYAAGGTDEIPSDAALNAADINCERARRSRNYQQQKLRPGHTHRILSKDYTISVVEDEMT